MIAAALLFAVVMGALGYVFVGGIGWIVHEATKPDD